MNPIDLAEGLTIRITRRRSSKKMAKELEQLDEDHARKARTDVVDDDVGDTVEEDGVTKSRT